MKIREIVLISYVLISSGCNQTETKRIPGEPYIEIEGTEANGIRRKYNAQGIIESEVPYKDSLPHGLQKTYYTNGKLFRETPVEKGEINGIVKEYYASGKLYREMPTIKGKAEGVVKKYYEEGGLLSEAPFSKGKPLPGLVEYDKKGNKIEHPKIILTPKNRVALDGMYIIEVSITDKNIVPEYSQVLTFENREVNNSLILEDKKGIFKIYVPKGSFETKTLTFEAKYTTVRNNICVLRKKYDMVVSN